MATPIGYLDYRTYLRDLYEERRRIDSFFSYRFMAQKVETSHSFLIRVLQGEKHLADESVDRFVTFLRLTGREEEYFRILVRFGRTRSENERKDCLEKLLAIQGLRMTALDAPRVDYFRGWLPSALRSLVELAPHLNVEQLAKCFKPAMPLQEVQDALELLQKLELIVRSPDDDRWILQDTYVTPGPGIGKLAVRQHQREILRLAGEALELYPPHERYIATATFTLAPADIPEAQDRMRELRDALLRLSNESQASTQVMELGVALYPVAQLPALRKPRGVQ